jgi:NDP-sugar pyrophosphorylase family protein
MKGVLMAGGEGSRLRPLTSRRPKPLAPVAGKPVMEHIIALLRRHGITTSSRPCTISPTKSNRTSTTAPSSA